jgi:hypothetical protein
LLSDLGADASLQVSAWLSPELAGWQAAWNAGRDGQMAATALETHTPDGIPYVPVEPDPNDPLEARVIVPTGCLVLLNRSAAAHAHALALLVVILMQTYNRQSHDLLGMCNWVFDLRTQAVLYQMRNTAYERMLNARPCNTEPDGNRFTLSTSLV